jgi:hypothetical protein
MFRSEPYCHSTNRHGSCFPLDTVGKSRSNEKEVDHDAKTEIRSQANHEQESEQVCPAWQRSNRFAFACRESASGTRLRTARHRSGTAGYGNGANHVLGGFLIAGEEMLGRCSFTLRIFLADGNSRAKAFSAGGNYVLSPLEAANFDAYRVAKEGFDP